ncbi:hypothetical protein REPUB_Repub04eG0181000 [Reevesia pubescens]
MEIPCTITEPQPQKFALPVDSERKATEFRLFSAAAPHMQAFHLSWISFFACFVSTFAAPPLLPIILDNLNLTATDIGNAGIASDSGAVFARIAMGTACDLFGPCLASASLILLTAPAVYFTSIVSSPVSFLPVRFFTGFSLSTFVSTQFCMSSMLSAPVVGTANGVAAGWGNLGGGATQLIMPLVFAVICDIAGIIAASLGLANLFSRPAGGVISDIMAKRFGMRGRFWALWAVQTLGGVFCIILVQVGSLSASVVVMIIFSVFVQAACALTFGVVPFVSRRSLGVISGMTGGRGNVGAILTQLIFFKGSTYSKETGITLMGVTIICCTLPIFLIYFPQWDGMFCGPSSEKIATEEHYYLSEWSSKEKGKGLHQASLKFADNSRSEEEEGCTLQLCLLMILHLQMFSHSHKFSHYLLF